MSEFAMLGAVRTDGKMRARVVVCFRSSAKQVEHCIPVCRYGDVPQATLSRVLEHDGAHQAIY